MYAYAGGNPINNFDPSGLSCKSSGGMITCSYPGGPTFSVPTPTSGWQDFTGNEFLYHSYDVSVSIGCADPNDVLRALINNPAPGNPEPASMAGTPNVALPTINGVPAPGNPIMSYLTNDLVTGNPVVVNMTASNSILDLSPGYVARTVSNGALNTYGEGLAWQQATNLWGSSVENYLDQQVWGPQSKSLVSQCGCQH